MSDAVTRAAEVLKSHRESIDRLDAIMIYTLGERFKHTQSVGKLKAEHDLPRPIRPRGNTDRTVRRFGQSGRLGPRFCQEVTPLHHR